MFLREAEPGEELAVARVHVRSWQAGYRDLLPQDYLDGLRPEERAQRYKFGRTDPHHPVTVVAEDAGTIYGFATTAPARDPDRRDLGELWALYVDPDRWGHGIGASLVSCARGRLLDMGYRSAILWVLRGNSRADRFYRTDGWSADGQRRTESIWGVTVDELRYRRTLDA